MNAAAFSDFHFLRPDWLWLLVPSALVVFLLDRSEDPLRPFKGLVAPHLLPHLLVGRRKGLRLRPSHLTALFLLLSTLALAGPAWQRERPPFAQDKAALVVALELSQTMDAIDVSPSRLERGKQKVRDLLARREGAPTGLVVYAGTAHTVLPLTDDPSILASYVEALATSLMPRPGNDAPAALALAESLLAKQTVPGTILFVTDGVATTQVPAFVAHHRASPNQVVALGLGTTEGGPIRDGNGFLTEGGARVVARLDRDGLLALAREADALVATATLDDSDVVRVQRAVQTHMEAALQQDAQARFVDSGWYLTPLLALLGAYWFRRGFTIRWAAAFVLLGLLPVRAEAADWRLADLWATRDQQAQRLFARGDYKAAAERFADPFWKGVACYRGGDYRCAVDALARVDTPEAWFDLGDSYARMGEWKLSVAAFEKALEVRPGWPEAAANRDLVAARLPKPKPDDEEGNPDPNLKPDEVKFDEKGKKGKEGQVQVEHLTDEQIARMWLRGVSTSPADFLRLKFAAQASGAHR